MSTLYALDIGAVETLAERIKRHNSIYVVGNGGSAANAAHLVLHLREKGYTTADLMADVPWLTMESNDRGYDQAVAAYVRSLPAYDDACLIVISGSGKSKNIMAALTEAREKQYARYGILGFGGGDAKAECHFAITLDVEDHGIHEDVTSAVVHMIARLL